MLYSDTWEWLKKHVKKCVLNGFKFLKYFGSIFWGCMKYRILPKSKNSLNQNAIRKFTKNLFLWRETCFIIWKSYYYKLLQLLKIRKSVDINIRISPYRYLFLLEVQKSDLEKPWLKRLTHKENDQLYKRSFRKSTSVDQWNHLVKLILASV